MKILTYRKQTLIAQYIKPLRLGFSNLTMNDNWISKHVNYVADVQISLIGIRKR